MDSGGPRKIVQKLSKLQKSTILEDPRKAQNCKKNVKNCPRSNYLLYVDKICTKRVAAAAGRRPSFGSGRRPRPYFCPKIENKLSWDNSLMIFWQFGTSQGQLFRGFSAGPARLTDVYVLTCLTISEAPPESIEIAFLLILHGPGGVECAGPAHCKQRTQNASQVFPKI